MIREPYPNELYHHGIPGQKWGERNGPPYPLNESDKSSAEKQKEYKGLSDKTKKNLKRVAIITAGTVIASIAGYELYKHRNELNKLTARGINYIRNNGYSTTTNEIPKYFSKATILQDALDKCNPDYINNSNKRMNCGNSVLAFEARIRGEKAIARNNSKGITIASMGEFFENIKSESIVQPSINVDKLTMFTLYDRKAIAKNASIVEKSLKKSIIDSYPDNARGCIFLPTYKGSHWFSFIKDNGNVIFVNPQDKNFNLKNDFFGYLMHSKDKDVSPFILRLDDLNFTDNIKNVITTNNSDVSEIFDTMISKGSNFVFKRY